MNIQATITGYLVGPLWQPGCEAWKPLSYDLTRRNAQYSDGKAPLRDHLCNIINDGDFQSCSIAQGVVEITAQSVKNGKRYIIVKTFPLERFKDAADIIHDDQDWFPSCPDDED